MISMNLCLLISLPSVSARQGGKKNYEKEKERFGSRVISGFVGSRPEPPESLLGSSPAMTHGGPGLGLAGGPASAPVLLGFRVFLVRRIPPPDSQLSLPFSISASLSLISALCLLALTRSLTLCFSPCDRVRGTKKGRKIEEKRRNKIRREE
jgi:hypothetical protein